MSSLTDRQQHRPRIELLAKAVEFAVWAAGEGISPNDGEAPDDFLFEYTMQSGDQDWESLPLRLREWLEREHVS